MSNMHGRASLNAESYIRDIQDMHVFRCNHLFENFILIVLARLENRWTDLNDFLYNVPNTPNKMLGIEKLKSCPGKRCRVEDRVQRSVQGTASLKRIFNENFQHVCSLRTN